MSGEELRRVISLMAIPIVLMAFAPCVIGGRFIHDLAIWVVTLGGALAFGGLTYAALLDDTFVIRGTTIRREDSPLLFNAIIVLFCAAAVMCLAILGRALYTAL
jgi:hypothetical protein